MKVVRGLTALGHRSRHPLTTVQTQPGPPACLLLSERPENIACVTTTVVFFHLCTHPGVETPSQVDRVRMNVQRFLETRRAKHDTNSPLLDDNASNPHPCQPVPLVIAKVRLKRRCVWLCRWRGSPLWETIVVLLAPKIQR